VIILDTNVISELTHDRPEPHVFQWIDEQPTSQIWTTSLTLAELAFGIANRPIGRRRALLADRVGSLVEFLIGPRVACFGPDAAVEWGNLRAARKRQGRSFSDIDLQIAAIALVCDAAVVTRDTHGFDHPELTVIDPWKA
jgi:predicted nucleic acid-binding protein